MPGPQPPYGPPPGHQPPYGPPPGHQPPYGPPPGHQPPYGPPPGQPNYGPPPGQQPPWGPPPGRQPYGPPGQPPVYGAPSVQQPPYGPPPGPAGPGPRGKKPWFRRWWAIALAAVLVIGIANAASEDDSKDTAASGSGTSASAKPSPSASAKSKAPAAAKPKPKPAPEPTAFGDGTYRVGADMPPGTYRSTAEGGLCYWARLSGFGGTLEEIIANGNSGPEIVRVAEGDAGFQSQGCGDWKPVEGTYPASPATSFGDGTFRVGKHLAPGTYRANGAPGDLCYWARLSSFSHAGIEGIIANGNSPGVVEISASDAGFTSFGCGEWTR